MCSLKVDLMKAYDSVRWDILLIVLYMVGFPSRMVNQIAECISTTRFFVSINEKLHDFFTSSRGLRQRDPMSPYTFVFAMKVYLELMGQVVRDKDFGFYWRCEKEQLTHLCFADDLMIFY